IEVIPGNVHSPEERRGWVVISITGVAVVGAVAVNCEMGPAIRVPGSGGFVSAEALTAAARVEPDREPSAAWLVVQKNRIALRTGEWALTARVGETSERGAAVGGDRCAGDINRDSIAAA